MLQEESARSMSARVVAKNDALRQLIIVSMKIETGVALGRVLLPSVVVVVAGSVARRTVGRSKYRFPKDFRVFH